MRYRDIEGLGKKDAFKQRFSKLLKNTDIYRSYNRIRIVPESIGEPAALLDFLDYDFLLAFKMDGVGTKSLIADKMARQSSENASRFYQGLGIDLVASNVNDLICLGATPIAVSDEIAAGDYGAFTRKAMLDGLFKGLNKGCREAGIIIPSGESPTLVDIVKNNTISITGSSIGIISPKSDAILGSKLKAGDIIYGLSSSGIHTNGLALARKLVEKLPNGYFTKLGKKTIGEVLLTPTRIYVKPIREMIGSKVDIHYMTHISGSSFRKISRSQKPFTYVIEHIPVPIPIFTYLKKIGNLSDKDMFETWNMGIGFVIIAPDKVEDKLQAICQKHRVGFMKMGHIEKGEKKVVINPINVVYSYD